MSTKYPLLNLMLEDMQNQEALFKPTPFWENGSKLIIEELEKYDVKDFRNLKLTRGFFVPGYTAPEYYVEPQKYDYLIDEFDKLVTDKRFTTRIRRLFVGHNGAYNDFRVLKASNIYKKPFTNLASESNIGKPIEQHEFEGRKFSRSFFKLSIGIKLFKTKC